MGRKEGNEAESLSTLFQSTLIYTIKIGPSSSLPSDTKVKIPLS